MKFFNIYLDKGYLLSLVVYDQFDYICFNPSYP
jgi:hypothetical protein